MLCAIVTAKARTKGMLLLQALTVNGMSYARNGAKPCLTVPAAEVPEAECVHAFTGLAPPRASNSSEIALAGSRRLMLMAAPVLFASITLTPRFHQVSRAST